MAEKQKAKSKGLRRWALYELSGSTIKRKNRFCPKCSDGVFMANHKDRQTCGRCNYSEFSGKK